MTDTQKMEPFKTPFRAEYASSSGTAFVVDARGNPVPPEWLCDRLNAASPSAPPEAGEREAARRIYELASRDSGTALDYGLIAEFAAIIAAHIPSPARLTEAERAALTGVDHALRNSRTPSTLGMRVIVDALFRLAAGPTP